MGFGYDADRAHPCDTRTVALPGVGKVPAREDMSWLTGRIADGRARVVGAMVRKRAGRWWVSFQIRVDRDDINTRRVVPDDAPTCGVDLGLKTFAAIVGDTGAVEEIQAPKPLRAALRQLRRANKAVARTQPRSNNRDKPSRRVSRLHLTVACWRTDFLHQLTTRLARTKRAIAVETLNVAGMKRNRRLARAISDAGSASLYASWSTRPAGTGRKCGRRPLVPVVEDMFGVWCGQRWSDPVPTGVGVCLRHDP